MSLVSLFGAALLMTTPATPLYPTPTVETTQGMLVGRAEAGVESFKGVGYAAPPVGPLRWRPPQAPSAWTGPRDAGEVGAICIQPPANGDPGVGPLPMSEDCLTLNVWAPERRTGPLPVMVWIHGGGYINGSGTAALYDGTKLARRGVVVVTLNYRLGRLGFFDHPALAAERGVGEAGGNYGVMDMIAALEWVRDSIAAFGGDPAQVTIFGESAGGVAVSQLMVADRARGLFSKAIIQSGLGRQQGVVLAEAEGETMRSTRARGAAWARDAGVAANAEALRAVPAERLLEPSPSFYGGDLILNDGVVIATDIETAFATGKEAPVPLIIGTNSAEFWWMKPSDLSPYGELDDNLTPEQRAALLGVYGGQAGYDAHVLSDIVFNEPARHLARLHARNGYPTFLYRFDVVASAMNEPHEGATHASERPYVFDTLNTSSWPTEARDQAAADVMAGYWTDFAKGGDPNGDSPAGSGRPRWPDLRPDPDQLLEFTNDGPVVKPVPAAERLNLIEGLYPRR
ncbi:carboxylesterase family protein [soil metagenome]